MRINNVDYKLKYGFRALFTFESITGRAFSGNTSFDLCVLFYSTMLANDGFDMQLDDFIDLLDEQPQLYREFVSWLDEEVKKRAIFDHPGESDKKKA